ncbi:MAG: hypothetical protein ACP5KO_01930 [Caldimicrobium sp.]
MTKSKILIILKEGESLEVYLDYIIDLQNLFQKEVIFLVIEDLNFWKFLEKHFVAVALSEEGTPDLVLEELNSLSRASKKYLEYLQNLLKEKNLEKVQIVLTHRNLLNEVRNILEKEFKLDLLIITPAANKYLFKKKSSLRKFLEKIKIPVITLSPKTS